jgi:hypothetical protein
MLCDLSETWRTGKLLLQKDRRIPKGELTSLTPISRAGHFPRIQEPQVLLGPPSRLHYFATLPVSWMCKQSFLAGIRLLESSSSFCSLDAHAHLWPSGSPKLLHHCLKESGCSAAGKLSEKACPEPKARSCIGGKQCLACLLNAFGLRNRTFFNILRMNGVHGSIDAGVNWSDSNLDMRSFSMLCQRGDSVRKCLIMDWVIVGCQNQTSFQGRNFAVW